MTNSAIWEASIPVRTPNSGSQKTLFKFYFSCISTKKIRRSNNQYFTMYLTISTWLRIQNYKQKRKTMRQRGRSERRNCQRKYFHSFKYVIDHVSIPVFFYVYSLHCFLWFLLHYFLHLLSSDHFAAAVTSL